MNLQGHYFLPKFKPRTVLGGRAVFPVRLGPRVLRTETAALAALAAINTLWGDF